jgi:hypothetical protein
MTGDELMDVLQHWRHPARARGATWPDYEGAILARQERETMDW